MKGCMLMWVDSLLAILLSSLGALSAVPEDPEDLRLAIEQLGWDLCEQTRVPGVAVALVTAGEFRWFQGCGFADIESQRDITEDLVFNIGSISKTVAACGLMQLVEQGKLALDSPVDDALTRWKLPESEFDARGVTLRRLLSHTAGLSLHGYGGFPPRAALPSIEASLSGETNGSGDVRILCEPGTQWKYSGGGYTIAQLMLEEASGLGFAAYMRTHVLAPLGMHQSSYEWTSELVERSATPYDEQLKPLPRGGPCFVEGAAAGLQTTARDLARFACACLVRFRSPETAQVLKAETLELMQSTAPAAPEYGLGFQVRSVGELRLVGHGGANEGWMARLTLAPDSGDAIVILTNGTNGTALIEPLEQRWIAYLTQRSKTEKASVPR